MLQRALGDQGTSHQSRESSETPRYLLSIVLCLSAFRPTVHLRFCLAALPDSTPRLCTHARTDTHTQTLMDTTWGRCSLAPNVLWRPRSRPPTAAQCVSAPLHTCHTWASVHKRNFSRRTRAYPHWQAQCTTTGGGVLWHLMSFGAPTTALWR